MQTSLCIRLADQVVIALAAVYFFNSMLPVDPWVGVDPYTLLKPKRRARPSAASSERSPESTDTTTLSHSERPRRSQVGLFPLTVDHDAVIAEVQSATDRTRHIIDTTDVLRIAIRVDERYMAMIGIQQGKLHLHTQAEWVTEAQKNIAHTAGWMFRYPAEAEKMIQLVQYLDKAFQVLMILHEWLQSREDHLIRQRQHPRGPFLGNLD